MLGSRPVDLWVLRLEKPDRADNACHVATLRSRVYCPIWILTQFTHGSLVLLRLPRARPGEPVPAPEVRLHDERQHVLQGGQQLQQIGGRPRRLPVGHHGARLLHRHRLPAAAQGAAAVHRRYRPGAGRDRDGDPERHLRLRRPDQAEPHLPAADVAARRPVPGRQRRRGDRLRHLDLPGRHHHRRRGQQHEPRLRVRAEHHGLPRLAAGHRFRLGDELRAGPEHLDLDVGRGGRVLQLHQELPGPGLRQLSRDQHPHEAVRLDLGPGRLRQPGPDLLPLRRLRRQQRFEQLAGQRHHHACRPARRTRPTRPTRTPATPSRCPAAATPASCPSPPASSSTTPTSTPRRSACRAATP